MTGSTPHRFGPWCSLASGGTDHYLPLRDCNWVNLQRRLPAEGVAVGQVVGVEVQRADDLSGVGLPVRDRSAEVRADRGYRPDHDPAVGAPQPEHRDLLV